MNMLEGGANHLHFDGAVIKVTWVILSCKQTFVHKLKYA